MRRPRTAARALRLLAIIVAPLAPFGGGACDTMSSDFGDFFESFSPPTPMEAAQWAVDTTDAENQRRGVALLASAPWGGAAPYVQLYRMYVEETTDPLVKAFAIRALGRHGDASDAGAVANQLKSPFKVVRLEAAKALQRLHDPAVADAIWQRMIDENNEDADIRLELAVALGQYSSEAVFQALVAGLDQRELGINWACLDSLQTLTGQDFGLDTRRWVEWRRSTTTPAHNQDRYLYPTFVRSKGFLDYLLFWIPLTFEDPAAPIGSTLTGSRRTYQGEEQPAADFQLPTIEKPDEAESSPARSSGTTGSPSR